jgi:hypothetical protein
MSTLIIGAEVVQSKRRRRRPSGSPLSAEGNLLELCYYVILVYPSVTTSGEVMAGSQGQAGNDSQTE